MKAPLPYGASQAQLVVLALPLVLWLAVILSPALLYFAAVDIVQVLRGKGSLFTWDPEGGE